MRVQTLRMRMPARAMAVLVLAGQAAFALTSVVLLSLPTSELPSVFTLSLALTALFAWGMVSWKLAGRPIFDPYCMFLISAFMFNAGHGLLEVIGSNEDGIMGGLFSDAVLKETLTLSLAGLAALHLGALAVVSMGSRTVRPIQWLAAEREAWTRRTGWMLLSIAVPASAIWLAQALSIVAASGYASLYERELQAGIAATPFVLSGLLVPGALFLTAVGRRHVLDRRVSATVILLFSAIQFYIGYRSTAAMPLLAWLWLHHRLIKPVRASVTLPAAAVLIFLVFPLVRETRNLAHDERSTESYWSMFTSVDNPALSSVAEMGSSMATTAHTVTLVPSSRPFDNGAGYGYALLTLFPNLFWDIHPTIERGTAGDWLVQSVNTWLAARGGAYGFSFIGEAYLNFGPFGVPVMLCFYGLLLAGLLLWAEKSGDPAKLAVVATILAFTLRFPRDELAGVIRPVIWFGVLPYLCTIAIPQLLNGALKTRQVRFVRSVAGARGEAA
jgi:oligosaccharide repeat unit polymerase